MSTTITTTPVPLLDLDHLTVEFDVDGTPHRAVDRSTLNVDAGEIVAIVGESGSGKSVTAMAILGLLPANAIVTGSIRFRGEDLRTSHPAPMRDIRGTRIAMIFQDPSAALNPVLTIGYQIAESVRRQERGLSRAEVKERVIGLLRSVEIPEPARRLKLYPHQLSGGQCQRVMIAMALASDPELLIADEPTTALDVTVQAEVLELLRRLRDRIGCSVVIITHDMGVVADLADRVVVMKDGVIVESARALEVFERPQAEYTQRLLAAVPRIGERPAIADASLEPADEHRREAALDVSDLTVQYNARNRKKAFTAVDGVTFHVDPGEIVALVGESGSGKSTIARASIGLAPITKGTITVAGLAVGATNRSETAALRQRVGVVFQNPATSLNPRYSVAQSVGEPLRVHRGLKGTALRDRTDELLDAVGFSPSWRDRYAHELSGGQRQRVAIARAVALDPDLLIADEPTSALDVSVQARVLDVFRDLQDRLGFACLFVTHDLAVVDTLCDRVVVLNRGAVVESGLREQVLTDPQEEYTRRLIAAAPVPDPTLQRQRRAARI